MTDHPDMMASAQNMGFQASLDTFNMLTGCSGQTTEGACNNDCILTMEMFMAAASAQDMPPLDASSEEDGEDDGDDQGDEDEDDDDDDDESEEGEEGEGEAPPSPPLPPIAF